MESTDATRVSGVGHQGERAEGSECDRTETKKNLCTILGDTTTFLHAGLLFKYFSPDEGYASFRLRSFLPIRIRIVENNRSLSSDSRYIRRYGREAWKIAKEKYDEVEFLRDERILIYRRPAVVVSRSTIVRIQARLCRRRTKPLHARE